MAWRHPRLIVSQLAWHSPHISHLGPRSRSPWGHEQDTTRNQAPKGHTGGRSSKKPLAKPKEKKLLYEMEKGQAIFNKKLVRDKNQESPVFDLHFGCSYT